MAVTGTRKGHGRNTEGNTEGTLKEGGRGIIKRFYQ